MLVTTDSTESSRQAGTAEHHLQVNGKAANVAQGDLKVDQQHIDMARDHNAKHQTNIYLSQLSPFPREDSWRYIQKCNPQGFGDGHGITYDQRFAGLVSTDESQLLTSRIRHAWEGTSSTVHELRTSVDKFYREVLNRGPRRRDSVLSLHKTFDDAANWFDLALADAVGAASSLRVRSSDTKALARIRQHIPSFFMWARTLSGHIGQTRCASLCYPFGCLVLTVADGVVLPSPVLTYLADITQYFSHAVHYLDLCNSGRLSPILHDETVALFVSVSLLLKTLLEYAWRGNKLTKQQGKENIEWLFEMKLSLEQMNRDAIIASNPSRRSQPSFKHRSDHRLDVLWTWNEFLKSTRSAHILRSDASATYKRAQEHQSGPSPTALIKELGYDCKASKAAIQVISGPGQITEARLSRLAALVRRHEFTRWLRAERGARGLLIHGNFEDDFVISPLSYLCAAFPQVYRDHGRQNVIFLHYFCRGQQPRRRRCQISATDVLKSFIGQLLTASAGRIDLGFVDKRYLGRIRRGDFEELCRLFVRLLVQLARLVKVVVFCFIDSISDIETPTRHENTERLLSTLQAREWEKGSGSRMLFKLLVTDAKATSYAHRYFGPSETINMNSDDEHNDERVLAVG